MSTDPLANLRHLDGKAITVRTTTPLEDVDGQPLGVTVDEYLGVLLLPSLPLEGEHDA